MNEKLNKTEKVNQNPSVSFKMLYLTLLACFSLTVAFPTSDQFHQVPLPNGSFVSLSGTEINKIQSNKELNPHFDARNDIVFHLYTQSNPTVSKVVAIDNDASLRGSNFDASAPTVFLVHGWIHDHNLFFVQLSKNEFLAKGKCNVFGVDWSKGGGTSNYIAARGRVGAAGKVVGQFIQFLEKNGANVKNMILAGYSLGAHVVGNAGKEVKGRLPVIHGLDPAGPLFFLSDSDRLMASDAGYVEVSHTNTKANGFSSPLGDADFYPNGGKSQPGCNSDGCSHDRAPYYFIESIRGKPFTGRRCRTYGSLTDSGCDFDGTNKVMGGVPHTTGSGVFYIQTNSASPYSRG